MDIYGLNPVVLTERPAEIDWENSTNEEKDEYCRLKNKWDKENPGVYFRANVWSWRPINLLCEILSNKHNLNIDFTGWDYNDGAGLKTQEECNKLADAFDALLEEFSESKMCSDDDKLQLCMGSWVEAGTGKFVRNNCRLDESYPTGTILFTPIVTASGKMVESSHSVQLWHLKEWIAFLRNCGGFEIN